MRQEQQVVDSLRSAAAELDESAETRPLADEVRALIRKAHFQTDDLRSLLNNIQSQIDIQQSRAQERYWESVGR